MFRLLALVTAGLVPSLTQAAAPTGPPGGQRFVSMLEDSVVFYHFATAGNAVMFERSRLGRLKVTLTARSLKALRQLPLVPKPFEWGLTSKELMARIPGSRTDGGSGFQQVFTTVVGRPATVIYLSGAMSSVEFQL